VRRLASAYDRVLNLLAAIAGILLAVVTVGVILDVIARNLNIRALSHTSALVEYSLLYITMLGSPWLLRRKGHVYIEVLLVYFPPRLRQACAILCYLLCLATCVILVYYSIGLTYTSWARGDYDIRSFDMPRWMLFISMPLSFGLMAVEFVRYLLGRDSLYNNGDGAAGL
jgi:C4-dicarboxylate transporter, DctQ subunit